MRFFAHLILVLRMLEQPLPEYAANRILEAYVSVLEANDQVCLSPAYPVELRLTSPRRQDENLIAFYASRLDSNSAVESYARFLLSEPPLSICAQV